MMATRVDRCNGRQAWRGDGPAVRACGLVVGMSAPRDCMATRSVPRDVRPADDISRRTAPPGTGGNGRSRRRDDVYVLRSLDGVAVFGRRWGNRKGGRALSANLVTGTTVAAGNVADAISE